MGGFFIAQNISQLQSKSLNLPNEFTFTHTSYSSRINRTTIIHIL